MSWTPEVHIGELRPWPDSVLVVRGNSGETMLYDRSERSNDGVERSSDGVAERDADATATRQGDAGTCHIDLVGYNQREDRFQCRSCDWSMWLKRGTWPRFNFCPNCGAKVVDE